MPAEFFWNIDLAWDFPDSDGFPTTPAELNIQLDVSIQWIVRGSTKLIIFSLVFDIRASHHRLTGSVTRLWLGGRRQFTRM
jgi:hypothetical protein